MQVQPIQSKVQEFLTQLGPKKITAIALNIIGAIALAAAAILAPVATPLTTALLIGGAAVFVSGFFLNFFTHVEKHEVAKGFWSNEVKDIEIGKSLDIVLRFDGKPLDMSASFNEEHKIVITWNETFEKVVEYNEIPPMIELVDNGSKYVYEKISPLEWLQKFKNIDVIGFTKNRETTNVQLVFS